MSYEPKPGTAPDRAIKHLRELGEDVEIMSSSLAKAIGIEPKQLPGMMGSALRAGAVYNRRRDTERGITAVYWSIADQERRLGIDLQRQFPRLFEGAKAQSEPERTPDQAPVKEQPPRVERAPAAPPATSIKDDLRIALWSDGTLQIQRNTVGGAADLVLFSRAETQQIVAYLDKVLLERERGEEALYAGRGVTRREARPCNGGAR